MANDLHEITWSVIIGVVFVIVTSVIARSICDASKLNDGGRSNGREVLNDGGHRR